MKKFVRKIVLILFFRVSNTLYALYSRLGEKVLGGLVR